MLTTGVAGRTGYSRRSVWFVPLLTVEHTWETPDAEVRTAKENGRLVEWVRPRRRALVTEVVRRFTVRDAWGLAHVSFTRKEPRNVRIVPAIGALRNVPVVRALSRGATTSTIRSARRRGTARTCARTAPGIRCGSSCGRCTRSRGRSWCARRSERAARARRRWRTWCRVRGTSRRRGRRARRCTTARWGSRGVSGRMGVTRMRRRRTGRTSCSRSRGTWIRTRGGEGLDGLPGARGGGERRPGGGAGGAFRAGATGALDGAGGRCRARGERTTHGELGGGWRSSCARTGSRPSRCARGGRGSSRRLRPSIRRARRSGI